ncbi:MAG TPA: ATP-dependent Clp protease proteolytic subunit [Candidatus Paceibacterota bacterium]|nr:ATP-dependent Clp protease proteolytic subunit [Candidatus Paceibacterota bacterium]
MEIWYALTGQVDRREAQDFIKWLNDELYSKPVKTLRLLIASSGKGEIATGINLYTYLKALPVDVETIAFGELDVASILFFLGGRKRLVVQGCQFYFREGRYTIADPSAPLNALEEAVEVFRREQREMLDILSRESGGDVEVIGHMLRRSRILEADDAKKFKFAHRVIEKLPLQQQQQIGFVDQPEGEA